MVCKILDNLSGLAHGRAPGLEGFLYLFDGKGFRSMLLGTLGLEIASHEEMIRAGKFNPA